MTASLQLKKFLEKHFINLAIVVVFVLILIGASLSFYNKTIMNKALIIQEQTDMIRQEANNTFLNIRQMDISARGYALMQDESFLYYTVEGAKEANARNFRVLDSLFAVQGYSDPENYGPMQKCFHDYADMYSQMVDHLKKGELDEYKAILKEDRAKLFWPIIDRFIAKLYAHQEMLSQEATADYEAAVQRNTILQILLLAIGLPTLAGAMFIMRKEARQRKLLLLDLQENNRKYLFNDGEKREKDAREILEGSIENLKKAADFVNEISEGNYEARWERLNEENKDLNQQNLAGRLVLMREQMKKVKHEDERRLWATEGLSQFSEVIRNYQHNLNDLTYQSLQFLVKYLKAQQGSLFVLEEQEEGEAYLQLAACYAFDRKKFVEKRISIGEGMIGQVYLEGETVFMTDVPKAYTYITSGLGDATPNSIIIVPMKYNEQVRAIIELASFKKYEQHEIALLEKAGEFIASAIATAQTNEKTGRLLEQLQAQTEQMRAQEEELRQNMEELEATQEEMRRKEMALERQLAEIEQYK